MLILQGLLTIVLIYPVVGGRSRLALKQRWSRALLNVFGIELEADLRLATPGSMLVANHISWLDIFAINAVLPAAFIAKEEVRHWPLFGWLAKTNETVFLRRGSRGHARIINQEIADLLSAGKYVAVFPEGSTTDGRRILHFHAALLQPALAAGRPVLPIAISYWEPDGSRSLAPRYDADLTMGDSIANLLKRRRTIARLELTPALGMNGEDRRIVAHAAREAIAGAAGIPLEEKELSPCPGESIHPGSNPPGKAGGLPDAGPSGALPTGSRNPAPADPAAA